MMCIAIPYVVLDVDGSTAVVRRDGVTATASLLAAADEIRPGDRVLVHCGYVLARLDGAEVSE